MYPFIHINLHSKFLQLWLKKKTHAVLEKKLYGGSLAASSVYKKDRCLPIHILPTLFSQNSLSAKRAFLNIYIYIYIHTYQTSKAGHHIKRQMFLFLINASKLSFHLPLVELSWEHRIPSCWPPCGAQPSFHRHFWLWSWMLAVTAGYHRMNLALILPVNSTTPGLNTIKAEGSSSTGIWLLGWLGTHSKFVHFHQVNISGTEKPKQDNN